MAYNVKFTLGKPLLITKAAGAAPPAARIPKGAALTHSLFGRYSASLSFPLVSPGKRDEKRASICIVSQWEALEDENNGKLPHSATPTPARMREKG